MGGTIFPLYSDQQASALAALRQPPKPLSSYEAFGKQRQAVLEKAVQGETVEILYKSVPLLLLPAKEARKYLSAHPDVFPRTTSIKELHSFPGQVLEGVNDGSVAVTIMNRDAVQGTLLLKEAFMDWKAEMPDPLSTSFNGLSPEILQEVARNNGTIVIHPDSRIEISFNNTPTEP